MHAEGQGDARLSEVSQCSPQDVFVALIPWCIRVEEHLSSPSFVTSWSKTFFDDANHVLDLGHVIAKVKFIRKLGGDRMTNLVVVEAKIISSC
jgi:hypothetical protein